MTTHISPLAGKTAPFSSLINVAKLVSAYYEIKPDPAVAAQRVVFGTSGHRGSAFDGTFNEEHVLAVTQAICDFRRAHDITGPLFLGIDTHALSEPAYASGLEVLAANDVNVMLATNDEYTPTPAISHAILTYNRGRSTGPADGIVITPSHNPPRDGGYKYNPPNGGPAGEDITDWIEAAANRYHRGRSSRRQADFTRESLKCLDDAPPQLSRYLCGRSRVGDRHGGDSRCRDPHGGRSLGWRRSSLLGRDCRTLPSGSHGGQRGSGCRGSHS